MVRRKHKLDVAIEEDFCLLGVVTDEPDYKLCWRINRAHGLALAKLEDLKLYHRRLKEEQHFQIFASEDEDSMVTYRIIKNRSEEGYFLEELKNLDYLVHIQGELLTERITAFMKAVGALPGVRMCLPVDLGMLRNRERLMLW